MKSIFKPMLVAAVLATAGFSAFSIGSHGPDDGAMMGQGRMEHMSPDKMKARMAKHQAELKAALKITASQEAAWTTFTTAMAPPADRAMAQRPKPEDMAKLTTPERIDKMKAMHTERHAVMSLEMDKRGDATKAFYATLTPEQQKVFDEKTMRHGKDGNGGKKGNKDHHDGKGGMMQPKKDAS